jgi:soluble lytic murein transglycosylase-like protein
MSTGNQHLTIRDYFDQVLLGRQSTRRSVSRVRVHSSESTTFHRLLTSLGDRQANTGPHPPTGLNASDYLNNPVRVKCHYTYRNPPTASGANAERAKKPPAAQTSAPEASTAEKRIGKSQVKMAPVRTNESTALSPDRSNLVESLVIEKNIQAAARKYDLSPELLRGVIRAESNFEVQAVSHAGARGLMQLMPATARELGVDNPFDIDQNIDGGARYLRKMLDKFGGDVRLALAAYNAGPGAVEKYGGQIPPYRETEQYVNRVLRFSKLQA